MWSPIFCKPEWSVPSRQWWEERQKNKKKTDLTVSSNFLSKLRLFRCLKEKYYPYCSCENSTSVSSTCRNHGDDFVAPYEGAVSPDIPRICYQPPDPKLPEPMLLFCWMCLSSTRKYVSLIYIMDCSHIHDYFANKPLSFGRRKSNPSEPWKVLILPDNYLWAFGFPLDFAHVYKLWVIY